MKELYTLKKMLTDELEEMGRSKELSKSSLDTIDKLAHAAKNLGKVIELCEMDEYSMAGGSYGGSYDGGGSYRGSYAGNSYEGGGNYSEGRFHVRPDGSYSREYSGEYSERRGRSGARRDSMGRYSRSSGGDMVEKLRDMMDEAEDSQTREEFKRFIKKIENMD